MMEGWDIENFKKLKILLVLFLFYLTENIIFLNLIIVFGFQRYTLYGMRYTIYIFKLKTVFITNHLLLITELSCGIRYTVYVIRFCHYLIFHQPTPI
jgi:hypothetical protein